MSSQTATKPSTPVEKTRTTKKPATPLTFTPQPYYLQSSKTNDDAFEAPYEDPPATATSIAYDIESCFERAVERAFEPIPEGKESRAAPRPGANFQYHLRLAPGAPQYKSPRAAHRSPAGTFTASPASSRGNKSGLHKPASPYRRPARRSISFPDVGDLIARISPLHRLASRPRRPAPRSTSVVDVGVLITRISPKPVKVNGHFCDIFEGTHKRVGKVALKRPRIGATGDNEGAIRIRVLSIMIFFPGAHLFLLKRFQQEAKTWEALRHPHILEFLGTFQRDGYFYCVSPFIENGSLVEYIALHVSVNRVKLLCETADAITYLHQQNVVHGDIKASNILISDKGQILLCDFGLTRTTDSRTSTAMKGAGTLRWQGQELWNSGSSKNFKSDVYAFGMTIVEVLTGDVPFPDLKTDGAVICAVLIENRRPPKDPAVSCTGLSYENVWAVAEACWPAVPEKRISMREAWQLVQEDPALTAIQEV